jgi:hypothetical protein
MWDWLLFSVIYRNIPSGFTLEVIRLRRERLAVIGGWAAGIGACLNIAGACGLVVMPIIGMPLGALGVTMYVVSQLGRDHDAARTNG